MLLRFHLLILLLMLIACAKPENPIFVDSRLAQVDEIKFCLTGDMGKGGEHQKAMAEALDREGCHRIYFLGDLVYPKGISSPDDPEFKNKFLDYYEPLLDNNPDLEFGLVLGNHDHAGKPEAWKDVFREYPSFFFPHYYYLVDYGGLCIVALDTSFYYYESKVTEALEQTMWLQKTQARLKKDCKVKVAVTHHPFKGGGYSYGEDDWERATGQLKVFLDAYVIGRFDIHVAGHVHALADDGKDEDTKMLISGAGGEVHGAGRAGFVVLTWRQAEPKRIGYYLRYVDIEPVVESYQEKQEVLPVFDPIHKSIPKSRVEETWLDWILNFFRQKF